MLQEPPTPEIACQQVMAEDASIFSVQWVDLPPGCAESLSVQELFGRYLGYIRKCTLTLIRPLTLESGTEFRLAGTGLSLLSFLPLEHDSAFLAMRISGGLLVQPRVKKRGELRLGVEKMPGKLRISLQLSDFRPRILGSPPPSFIRFWLYRLTQAAIHRLVTVRFLSLLYQELTASSARGRVVEVAVRSGRAV